MCNVQMCKGSEGSRTITTALAFKAEPASTLELKIICPTFARVSHTAFRHAPEPWLPVKQAA